MTISVMRAIFFFVINILGLILLYRLLRGTDPKPTPLKMEKDEVDPLKTKNFKQERNASKTHERSLNCLFQYNGHSWDAFEILGVPAGSSLEVCEKAYLKAKSGTAQIEEIFEVAWQAIQSTSKNSKT